MLSRIFKGRSESSIGNAAPGPMVPPTSGGLGHSTRWVTVGVSVPGRGHVHSGIPCQDSFNVFSINRSWQLMVTSDGAGSALHSQRGSTELCTTIVPRLFSELVETGDLNLENGLPSQDEWARIGGVSFKRMREELTKIAEGEGLSPSEYNATVSIALFSKAGLLVGHIGDGRGAYLNSCNEWVPSMRPHKGEEPNQTVFLSSKWDSLEFSPNGVTLPEFSIYEGPIHAVALLTDGMEKHAFECSVIDPMTSEWSDPNKPYPRFFSPLRSVLLDNHAQQEELNEAWTRFLTVGTPALEQEHDDKTFVFACLLDEQNT